MLRSAGLTVLAPDGRGMCLADRVKGIEAVLNEAPVVLAGSSYGGLAAAYLAEQYTDCLAGLLLLAPALHISEAPVADSAILRPPASLPTTVIHGLSDTVVPVAVSQRYCDNSHARMIAVDDDHRLAQSLPLILSEAQRLLGLS